MQTLVTLAATIFAADGMPAAAQAHLVRELWAAIRNGDRAGWVTRDAFAALYFAPLYATADDNGTVACAGCAEQGHHARVNVGALEVRHLPFLKPIAGDIALPIWAWRVGCATCNRRDADNSANALACGIACAGRGRGCK